MSSEGNVMVDAPQPTADSVKGNTASAPQPGPNSARALLPMLLLASIGAILAWGVAQPLSPVFSVPEEFHVADIGAPIEKLLALKAAQEDTSRKNAMLEFSILGGLLGALLALSGPRQQWHIKGVSAAALFGISGGALAGFLGLLAFKIAGVHLPLSLNSTVLLYAIMLGTVGLCIGLGLGLPTKSVKTNIAWTSAGAVAGVLAGVLYPVLSTTILAAGATDNLLPTGAVERLLCYLTFAAALAIGFHKASAN